jgi:hypothetical protein
MFQHKRIAFKDESYILRSLLAVCHWNENVGRESVNESVDTLGRKFKVLPQQSYKYKDKLCDSFLIQQATM